MKFLNSWQSRTLSILLLMQAAAFYAVAYRPEHVPYAPPLAAFPANIDGWEMAQDLPLEPEVLDVLKADDTLNRLYARPALSEEAFLFIAFFKTQRYGQAPHSPKNCLPGSGWEPIETGTVPITVPDRPRPIVSNRYVVAHGEQKSVVLYWYQSHGRVIASEYLAKFWLVADAIRYHRSDTALVRVVVPVRDNDTPGATRIGEQFVQSIFPAVTAQLPM
jgi:EpsI family protein